MTAAAFQSLGISDDTKERLNKLVIGVATISADNLIWLEKPGSEQGIYEALLFLFFLCHLPLTPFT
jgi:hypothetical protein